MNEMHIRPHGIDKDEVVRRGHEVYERVIKPVTRPEDHGKFFAVDVISEDYEINEDDRTASDLLRRRRPDGARYLGRVGYPTTYTMRGFG